mgnify:CR=1 FL=1
MIAEVGIVVGDGRPRLNASIPELMDMELPMFMHIRETLGDRFSEWKSSKGG